MKYACFYTYLVLEACNGKHLGPYNGGTVLTRDRALESGAIPDRMTSDINQEGNIYHLKPPTAKYKGHSIVKSSPGIPIYDVRYDAPIVAHQ